MFRRPHYLVLGVTLIFTVIILKLPSRTASQFKLAISGLFLPVFGLTASAEQLAEKAGNSVAPKESLVQQINQLQKENQELKMRAMQAEEWAKENTRLRDFLGWQKQSPWKLKMARVVSRDPANWWRTIRIDLGVRDGVVTNCAVLTPQGLVGRVSEVGYAQSQVVLVGDPDCRVSVVIDDEKGREHGVIAPASSSPLDTALVDLSFLSRNAFLKPGQRVLTSGLGGIFPPGITVGHVVDYRAVGFGLYNEARVRLAVNMNTLEVVTVKLP